MNYLIDTDTIIYWLKGNENIENRVVTIGLANIYFSIISKAELFYGAYNSLHVKQNVESIRILSEKMTLVMFDDSAAEIFGKTKYHLKKSGNIIPDADIMIAAIARSNNLTLVTNNKKHFERIENLKIESWI